MFPPETKVLVDTLPLPLQLAIYAIMFACSIAFAWNRILAARKKETKEPDTAVLYGMNATIADMRPVRNAVNVLYELCDTTKKMAADIDACIDLHRKMLAAMTDLVEMQRESADEERIGREVEQRLRERERELKDRPGPRR